MTATLKPTFPAGGILSQHVDEDFTAFVAGRPVEQRVCIAVFQAASVASGNREAGRVNKTAYEALHFVEVTDAHEADRIRHLLTQTRADRGLAVHQPALFDHSEDEQRERLIKMVREWASEQDLPMADIDERWLSYFGGPEHASSATVQAGSLLQLKEFAFYVGVIADETPAAKAATEDNVVRPLFSDNGEPADDLDGDDDLDDEDGPA